MSEFAYILDFLWRSYTGVYQDKKIQKVREIGHLRHIWFEYTHSKRNGVVYNKLRRYILRDENYKEIK